MPDDASEKRLVSRPDMGRAVLSLTVLVTSWGFLANSFSPGHHAPFQWLFIPVWVIGCLAACYALLQTLLNRVIADGNGLHWRFWTGRKPRAEWQFCAWEEITDVYFSERHGLTVETSDGPTLVLPYFMTNRERFCDLISRRAINAHNARGLDGKSAILFKGTRPSDLPMEFFYDFHLLRREFTLRALFVLLMTVTGIVTAFGVLWMLYHLLRGEVPGNIRYSMWEIPLTLAITVGVAACIWKLGTREQLEPVRIARTFADAGQRLTAGKDGLTVTEDGEDVTLTWDSIIGWEFPGEAETAGAGGTQSGRKGLAHIRTATNRVITFSRHIKNYQILRLILKTYATEGVEYRAALNQSQALGGVASRWTGHEEGKGARVFNRRTRRNLTKLVFQGLALSVLCIILSLISVSPTGRAVAPSASGNARYSAEVTVGMNDNAGNIVWVVPFLIAGLAVAFYDFLRCRIEADSDGLTQFNLIGTSRLRWEDILRVEVSQYLHLETVGGKWHAIKLDSYAFGSELAAYAEEQVRQSQRARQR